MAVMPTQTFPIAPAPPSRRWGLAALIAGLLLLPVAIGAAVVFWPTDVEIQAARGGLTVRGSVYGRTFAPADLDAAGARRVSLGGEPGLAPTARTNGVGLPGYQAGWFSLRDGRSALLFMSDWDRAVLVPTTSTPLLLSPTDPDAFLVALKGGTDATMPLAPAPRSAFASPAWWAIPTTTMLIVGAGLVLLGWRGGKVTFELDGQALTIRGSMYGRSIPRSKIELSGAEIAAMTGHERFGRMLRLNGVGLPNYLAGWFRPRGGGRALLFVTDPGRVVALPTTDGYTLVISPADPDGLLAALRS